MKRSLAIIGILVAGLSLLLYFQLRSQRMAAEGLPGSSATIEGTEVDVVSRVGGRIASVEVREGDEVAVGQEVVTLDCPEQEAAVEQAVAAVARAKAELQAAGVSVDIAEKSLTPAERRLAAARASAQASAASKAALRARLSNAQRQEQRMENLVANGVGTPEALDRARALVEELRSQLDALESQRRAAGAQAGVIRGETRVAELQVDLARQRVAALETEVQRARTALEGAQAIHEECSLTAPRDGYVSTRNYEPGEVVLPGAAILTLVDIRVVEAVFYLPNRDLEAGRPGRRVLVVPDAYPEKTFEGTIQHVAKEAEFTPRSVQTRDDRERLVYAVHARIPNPEGRLRPGMPVEITVPGDDE